jgi:hypothetical protein
MSHVAKDTDFVPAKEAAFLICKSIDFLERLRKNGGGPDWHLIGGRIFYSRSVLMRWVEAGRNKRAACPRSRPDAVSEIGTPR